MIEEQSVPLQVEDEADMASIIAKVNPVAEENFPLNSPQIIFWDQQVKYNELKNKRQMRWHPLVLRFALNLKYMSTSAYKAMQQSGIIHLLSERTLSDYTHWSQPHTRLSSGLVPCYKMYLVCSTTVQFH